MNHACVVLLVVSLGISRYGFAADWPTFGHDNQRSHVTSESLKPPLRLQWMYDPPSSPAPGWSLPVNGYGALKTKPNVSFDDSHPAILVGDTVYFSSSAENCVFAVAADSGEIKWTFFTDAAPRLAPAYAHEKLYFGADDGQVYCLDPKDGRVIWTLNAAPTTETMLGYGRFSSLWPIRTGVLVDSDVAYFTAGLFPSEGVYLYAVNPQNGKLLWRKEIGTLGSGISLSPQGYMLATDDSLFVTSRVAPTRFTKSDGGHVPFATPYPDRPKSHEYRFYVGGDYAQIWDGNDIIFGRACLLKYDPDKKWTNRYRQMEQGALDFSWFNARQTVLNNQVVYFAMDDNVLSIDKQKVPAAAESAVREFEDVYKRLRVSDRLDAMREYEQIVAEYGQDHPRAIELKQQTLRYSQRAWDEWVAESPKLYEKIGRHCRWMLSLHATESLILAGDVLYAGGNDAVHAIDAATGKLLWRDSTNSRVRGIAAASGRLVVSTIDGRVRCYAASTTASANAVVAQVRISANGVERAGQRADASRKLVDKLLAEHSFPRGHGLIVGGDGSLARELVRRTGLTVQVLVADPDLLPTLRRQLAAEQLYGHKITAKAHVDNRLPFAPYLFNLVIDASTVAGNESPVPLSELYRVTRPLTGLTMTGRTSGSGLQMLDSFKEKGARVVQTAGQTVIRRGAIPGARDWSHNYASPANTYGSEDQHVKGPFGILWYGDPGPRQRIDRHETGPMPLVVNGIMFTTGYNRVMAYDVYNGALYWERFLYGSTRAHLPIATSNVAADKTGLFIIVNNTECRHLDAETGKTLKTYVAPARDDNSTPFWGWLARDGELLFGSRSVAGTPAVRPDEKHSDELFAVDVPSGEYRWTRRVGRVEHDGIAIGGRLLFYADKSLNDDERAAARKTIPREKDNVPSRRAVDRRGRPIEPDLRKLVALDCDTGAVKWEIPFDATDLTLDDNAVLDGRSGVSCMYSDGVVVVHGTGSLGHPHRQFLAGEFARRSIYAFSSGEGRFLWGGRKGYRKRPIIAGDYVYAEPFAWHVKTGEPKSIQNPLSGETQPLDFHRGYTGCSHLLASGAALFGNKSGIGYCNLDSKEGFSAFRGLSLACGLGAAPANGVFIAPEGRSGCTCASSGIHTSVALYPRTFARDWAVGVAGGIAEVQTLPVKRAYINLGAPGYREDDEGRLWLPYPPLNDSGYSGEWLSRYQHPSSAFYYHSPDVVQVTGHRLGWLFTSGFHGTRPITLQLQQEQQPAATYTVTLYFAELEDTQPGQRVFDVLVQGKPVLTEFDIHGEAQGVRRAITRRFANVSVTQFLTIALKPNDGGRPPVLSAIAVERE